MRLGDNLKQEKRQVTQQVACYRIVQ